MQSILWKVQPTESIQIVAQREKTLYLQRIKTESLIRWN